MSRNTKSKGRSCSFHSFPKDLAMLLETKLKESNVKDSHRVCCRHFLISCLNFDSSTSIFVTIDSSAVSLVNIDLIAHMSMWLNMLYEFSHIIKCTRYCGSRFARPISLP